MTHSTREQLLDVAVALMLEKGFSASSIGDICKIVGITKGGFFHHFESKEDLALAAIDHYMYPQRQMLMGGLPQVSDDPLERIYGYLDLLGQVLLDPNVPTSCLLGNFSQEIATTYPIIRQHVLDGFKWWASLIEIDLEKAKEVHKASANFNSKSVSEHFIVVYEGSLILAKASQDDDVVRQSLQHYKQYLTSLFSS